MRHQQQVALDQRAHRGEVLHRVVGQLAEQVGIGGLGRVGGDEQRVAIRRRPRHRLGRDAAAGAGLVLDDHRHLGGGGDLRADRAGQAIGGAAGTGPDHDRDRLGRIGAGGCRALRPGGERGQAGRTQEGQRGQAARGVHAGHAVVSVGGGHEVGTARISGRPSSMSRGLMLRARHRIVNIDHQDQFKSLAPMERKRLSRRERLDTPDVDDYIDDLDDQIPAHACPPG